MRALRTWGPLAAIALAAAVLPIGATGAPAANEATFTDSTGEDPAGPDITTVVVSNNDAGVITFRVNVPNRPQLTRDAGAFLYVNSDSNPSTGDPELLGADYIVQLVLGEPILFKWDGADFTARPGDPPQASLGYSWAGGAISIRISAAELGNTRKLAFFVAVFSGVVEDPVSGAPDFTNVKVDGAPGGFVGAWSYDVKVGRPSIVVKRFRSTPVKPASGKPFSLRLAATRSDTGAAIRGGRVTCVGRVGSARLSADAARFVGSEAVCTWRIPPTAKGKTFRGSITIVFEGLRSTRTFTGRIG